MSQIYKSLASGPTPPTIATQYVLDENSPAIPAANILNVIGGYSGYDNANGILTTNTAPNDNTISIWLTNRFQSTATTTDGVTPVVLLNFDYPLEGTYTFEFKISAYNVTDQLSASYWIQIARRSDGVQAYSYGDFEYYPNEETTMVDVVVSFPASYALVNQLGIEVTGLTGKTINWVVTGLYNFVGV